MPSVAAWANDLRAAFGTAEMQAALRDLQQRMRETLAQMQQQAADFMTHAAQVIQQIQSAAQPQVVVANEPRNKVVRVKRVNGELIGTVEES